MALLEALKSIVYGLMIIAVLCALAISIPTLIFADWAADKLNEW